MYMCQGLEFVIALKDNYKWSFITNKTKLSPEGEILQLKVILLFFLITPE